MEGYSVTEAASILGVPTERVWELLARGVLAGAAEGETGMRVYLQPRPAPAARAAEASRSNGDPVQREPERELSPFRELLTEFRNLTERYGQALLALGEARGEVAALRSRVDLLEARMDLRLPMSGGIPAPTPWPAPPSEPISRPPAPEREIPHDRDGDESAESAESAADEDRPSRRRRSGRHATESFAEALARAEDPTRPELPGAADAAAALAALRADASAEHAVTDAVLPRELPAAESMPMPDETGSEPLAPAAPVQPQAAPAVASEAEQEPSAAEVQPEPEPMVEAVVAEPGPEPEPERMVEAAAPEAEPEPEVRAVEPEREPAPEAAPPVATEATHPVDEAVRSEPQPDAAPISFDPERYTVEIEEPDWWVEEEQPASPGRNDQGIAPPAAEEPPDQALTATSPAEPEPLNEVAETPPAREDAAPPAFEVEAPAVAEHAPAATLSRPEDHEETMLWFGSAPEATSGESSDGADEMEVVGGPMSRPSPADLPGSRELDEALAALDALAGHAPGASTPLGTPRAADRAPTAEPVSAPGTEPEPAARPVWPIADRSVTSSAPPTPGLTSTPASRAYRRLRRIFPG